MTIPEHKGEGTKHFYSTLTNYLLRNLKPLLSAEPSEIFMDLRSPPRSQICHCPTEKCD